MVSDMAAHTGIPYLKLHIVLNLLTLIREFSKQMIGILLNLDSVFVVRMRYISFFLLQKAKCIGSKRITFFVV